MDTNAEVELAREMTEALCTVEDEHAASSKKLILPDGTAIEVRDDDLGHPAVLQMNLCS